MTDNRKPFVEMKGVTWKPGAGHVQQVEWSLEFTLQAAQWFNALSIEVSDKLAPTVQSSKTEVNDHVC